MPSAPDSPSTFTRLVGRAVERVEDAALLTGRGRFADDVGERPGTAHAAVLRSPHAHAEIVSLDAAANYTRPWQPRLVPRLRREALGKPTSRP